MFHKVEVKKDRLYEKIIDNIVELINAGTLAIGDYLPSERDLAEQFGVSRVPVREAIKTLEFLGVLESNKGLRVADSFSQRLTLLRMTANKMGSDAFADVIEAREPIELKIVELACENHSDEDLAKLDKVVEKMQEELRTDCFSTLTAVEFHSIIMKACQNSILIRLSELMDGLLEEVREQSLLTTGRQQQSYAECFRIIDAIRNRDKKKARKEMIIHLSFMRKNYANSSRE